MQPDSHCYHWLDSTIFTRPGAEYLIRTAVMPDSPPELTWFRALSLSVIIAAGVIILWWFWRPIVLHYGRNLLALAKWHFMYKRK